MTDDLNSRAGLLPCPFCGADAKLRGGPLAQETYSIWCRGTPSHHQDYGLDAEKAIAAWNTRALPAAQVQAEPENCGEIRPMRHACTCNEPWCQACAPCVSPPAPDDLDAVVRGLQNMLDQYADKKAYTGFPKALRDGIAAITALRASEPSEYEKKVAQMKEDFPNGI